MGHRGHGVPQEQNSNIYINSTFKNANLAIQPTSLLKPTLTNRFNSDMIDTSCPILHKKVHQPLKVSFKDAVDVRYYFPEFDDLPSLQNQSK